MQVQAGLEDFLPILILFAISSWFNHQKKKKAEAEAAEARRKASGGQGGSDHPAAIRTAPQPVSRADEDEEEDDWTAEDRVGERSERWDDRGASEARSPEVRTGEARSAERRDAEAPEPMYKPRREPPRPMDVHRELPSERRPEEREDVRMEKARAQGPLIPTQAREKAQEKAQDLLTQIAKELGLQLPEPPPRPAPRPQGPAPAPSPAPTHRPQGPVLDAARSRGLTSDEVRARTAEAGRARPGSLSATRPAVHPQPLPAPAASLVALGDLSNPESLRRAFILKTILDKPLSRQPRHRDR